MIDLAQALSFRSDELFRSTSQSPAERARITAALSDARRLAWQIRTAASGERDGEFGCDAADRFEKGGTAVAGSGDIEHDQLVRAFGVVAGGERDGIAGVTKSDKIDAFDNSPFIHIQTGNNSFR